METFDVIVLGGGPAGENAAAYAAEGSGLSVAIVEDELLGGECSYFACIPSKALLRPLELVQEAEEMPGIGTPSVDSPTLLAHRDWWVADYSDAGQLAWAKTAGVTTIRGRGRLVGERQVLVSQDGEERRLSANRAVVLATGSVPFVPPTYLGLAAWGSRDVTGVVEVPDRLLIIGGGVVACEAATWMRRLGSDVTLVVRGSRLLGQSEPVATGLVAQSLEDAGVRLLFGCEVEAARRVNPTESGLGRVHGGEVVLQTSAGELRADELLLAVGRRPNRAGLGLADLGIDDDAALGEHPLPWLWAVGDVTGAAQLTHWGKYRARAVGAAIAAGAAEAEGLPNAPVPQAIFTDPAVGSVGLTAEQARAQGHNVEVVDVAADAVAGAGLTRGRPVGHFRLVIQADTGIVLGATFVGPAATELVHSATVAIVGQVPVWRLWHAVPSFPTVSELWLRALEALPAKYRHRGSATQR